MAIPMEIDSGWTSDRVLGCGGFGIVKLWSNMRTGQRLAIKQCRWDDTQLTERQKERWVNEVDIMKRLRHTNIIATEPVPRELIEMEKFLPVLCMEYCSKGDLRNLLNQDENCCGITERDALTIIWHISSAVQFLHHHNITHRDLKPENIVLQEWNNKITYKLVDLGFAKELGEESVRASIVGSMYYLAPEFLWKKTFSCTVDYWGLGILFYEVLTGTRPLLANMPHNMIWMKHIKNKEYEHICAHEVDDKVIFGSDIVDPTDISDCIRIGMVNWFRVVLQWDPKKRGRQCDGTQNEVVVFKLLMEILCKKIIYVFCVQLYRIFTYEVNETTTFQTLHTWIERDTDIKINQQLLIDSLGKMLNVKEAPVLTQLQDPCLSLFKQGSVLVTNLPPPKIPEAVQKMIEQPKVPLNNQSLRQYYSAAIFFVKQEIKLYRLYILALSMKIDLVNTRFNILKVNVEKMMSCTKALMTEVESTMQLAKNGTVIETWKDAIGFTVTKIGRVSEVAEQMKIKCELLVAYNEILRKFADFDCMYKSQEVFYEMLNIFQSLKKEDKRIKNKPTKMTKMVFRFLKLRETQIQDPQITEIAEQMLHFEEELLKLEESVNSASILTGIYRQEFSNLQQETYAVFKLPDSNFHVADPTMSYGIHASSSSLTPSNGSLDTYENVIYDNLVIRYMTQDLITEMHENVSKIVNL